MSTVDEGRRVAPATSLAPESPPWCGARGVTAFYGVNEVLHGVDLDVRGGRCLALVGESGSGKTTIARCIAGIHPGHIEGEIKSPRPRPEA